MRRGGYVLAEPDAAPRAVIIATGSEVALAVDAQQVLAEQGDAGARRFDAIDTVFDRQSQRAIAIACCRRSCRASPSKPARRISGASTSVARAPWSVIAVRRVGAGRRALSSFRPRARARRRSGDASALARLS